MTDSEHMTREEVASMINQIWRSIIEFPSGQICKHLAVCKILDACERYGFDLNPSFVKCIVYAYDDDALDYTDFRAVVSAEKAA